MNKTKRKAARPQPAHRGPEMVKISATEYEKLLEVEALARQITFDVFLSNHYPDWIELLHSRMRAEMKELFDPDRALSSEQMKMEIEIISWETLDQIKTITSLKNLHTVLGESNV